MSSLSEQNSLINHLIHLIEKPVNADDNKPITALEFYSGLILTSVAFLIVAWVFGTLPF
jgi:hypothetical protein